jgi:hypothetical protein
MAKKRSMADDIVNAVTAATQKWTKTVKKEERNPSTRRYRYQRMTGAAGVRFRAAAWEIMEQAYNQASGNGKHTALARQIMYAARPYIQGKVGKELQSKYFTQTLLPDYIEECGCHHWKTGYDPRGHLVGPHDNKMLRLGIDEVRHFLQDIRDPKHVAAVLTGANIDFNGPKNNWSGLLFIEKEGFGPLMREAQFADRYDLATMSTKGMSVTAARELADEMCSKFDIPLLTFRDFDKTGFSISGTLQRDTRRYEFKHSIKVIELGLSLDDVKAVGLDFEYQVVKKGRKDVLIANLRENGATAEEVTFMFADWYKHPGCLRRVELNALTSPQFVQFLDDKLKKHGIKKVVPQADELANAYGLFVRNVKVEAVIKDAIDNMDDDDEEIEAPKNLEQQVRKYLEDHPTARWDEAVQKIAKGNDDDGDGADAGGGGGDDGSPTPPPPEPKQTQGVRTFKSEEELFNFALSAIISDGHGEGNER